MDILIHCGGMPFNGNTLKTQSLGGSESAAYYQARELARRGHRVVCCTNSQEEGLIDGVIYLWSGNVSQHAPLGHRFQEYACNTPHDVLIIQRHPLAFHRDYASKVNVLQLHDISLRRSAGAFNAGAGRLDLVTTVSQFHREQTMKTYGFSERLVKVVPNGVDLDLYTPAPWKANEESARAYVYNKKSEGALALLYQSRPERGLEHLLRPGGIMDRLAQVGSTAHLFYCTYDHVTDDMRGFYDYLHECAKNLPNVTRLGSLTKDDLAEVQMQCDALVYPTEFEEVSCITAMEAMAAGLPFISSAHGALPETCRESGSILIPLKDGAADEDAFVEALLTFEQAGAESDARNAYRSAQLEAAETRSWEDGVDVLEDAITAIFNRRSASGARVARNLIEHSDIAALNYYHDNVFVSDGTTNAIHAATVKEVAEMYDFASSLDKTIAHYSKWEGMNCDRMEQRGLDPAAERESVMHTTRYRGIAELVRVATAQKAGSGIPVRVLEFGCAHGHITLLLAEQFPDVQFVGMDFMQRSITLATKTAEDRDLKNVSFLVGSLDELRSFDPFDAIVAPEVMEHIYDHVDAFKKILAAIALGGTMIITVPNGRWEWSGRDWWPRGREHLHHFERADIDDMFQDFPRNILHGPSGHESAGGAVGSWVFAVQKVEGAEVSGIDYDRKLALCAPRDTLSLCMIVKDAQSTIERALRSIVGYVDEVVIAIDETTTDLTLARIEETLKDFPHVARSVWIAKSPLEIGFDAARNATLDASCGDWVFWIDADEEVVDARNLWRCLRPGAFNAYGIAQHHMSQKPATVLATDFPSRLFRRDSGARFYGIVHEHPETEMGRAIPHMTMLGDVSIMHHGYTTEAARRGRYLRNLPLLLKDIEQNPNRTINKFLYLRDLSQGIAFEGEQTGGVSPKMQEDAKKCVALFDELIDKNPMLRMTIDAVPYYSTAVATLMTPSAFMAKINIETKKDELPGLKASVVFEGLFHNREIYMKFLARIAQETVVNYDEKYL